MSPSMILRVVVPVGDVSLAEEHARSWNSRGHTAPSGQAVSKGAESGASTGNRGVTVAVVEALDGVRLAVPARIVVASPRCLDPANRVPVRGVSEDVAGVVGDDVEDHVDAVLVGEIDEVAEVLARPEVWIDVEEVLDAVAVVARGSNATWRKIGLTQRAVTPRRLR